MINHKYSRKTIRRLIARERHNRLRRIMLKPGPFRDAVVRLDRFIATASEFPKEEFWKLPDYRCTKARLLRPTAKRPYCPFRRVAWFKSKVCGSRFCVEYERLVPWVSACKVSIYADDFRGLLPDDLFAILQFLPGVRLTLVEIAVDFNEWSPVTASFVRRFGKFGKSRPRRNKNRFQIDRWGARRSPTTVRSYWKKNIRSHRVEIELHRQWLRRHKIKDVFDFPRLADLLPARQFGFFRTDWGKLARHLERRGLPSRLILEESRRRSFRMSAVHAYLRQEVGLTNTHRFLRPLLTNERVRYAFRKWGRKWILQDGGKRP